MPDPYPSDPPAPSDAFDLELASLRYFDRVIDAEEMARLSAALKADHASRVKFIRLCVGMRQLREILAARNGAARSERHPFEVEAALFQLAEQAARAGQPSSTLIQSDPSKPRAALAPYRRMYGIAAGILILVSVATALFLRHGSTAHPAGIASLAGTLDATWLGPPPSIDTPLPRAELRLLSGFAILHFDNGAKVVVEGPARFTPQPGGIALADGRLSALVPPPARGFSVQTLRATIIDLGTEFGVRTGANGDTDLKVFQGRVSLQAVGLPSAGSAQTVTADSARRVTGQAISDIPFQSTAMVRVDQINKWMAARTASPFERWKAWSERVRRDPDVIAYYTFDPAGHPPDRLPNLASTGETLDGTLEGAEGLPTWTTGRWETKGALAFHGGSTQHVILAASHGTDRLDFSGPEMANPFTIAVWVKAAPSQSNSAALVSRGPGASEQFTIDIFRGCFRAFVRRRGGYGTLGSTAQSTIDPTGRWQYVVAVYDPAQGALSLYINGILAGIAKSAPHRLIAAGSDVSFGSRLGITKKFTDTLDGAIDEITIWERPLSAEEVVANYLSGKPE